MPTRGSEETLGESAAASAGAICPVPPLSTEGGAPTVATFASAAEEPLQLCWLDTTGRERPVATVAHGRPHAECTQVGHTFVLRRTVSAELVAWYRPTHQLQGTRHAVLAELLPSDGWRLTVSTSRDWQQSRVNPEYRVILRPSSCGTDATGRRKPGVPLPPPSEDWLLRYRYDTPPYPTAGWIPTEHTFFIWGDVDFDQFNAGREWSTVAPGYRFNQIVPQLMSGWCLAGNDDKYHTAHEIYDHCVQQRVIQAQYYWQRVAGNSGPPSRASCGPVVRVQPGDIITTEIEFTANTGCISARIFVGDDAEAAEVAGKMSALSIPRPFPEPDRIVPAYASWREFFEAAADAARAEGALCNPAVQIESKWVSPAVVESIFPWTVSEASLTPGTAWSTKDWGQPFVVTREDALPPPLADPAWAQRAMLLDAQFGRM